LYIQTANGAVGQKAFALHDHAVACRTDRDDVGAEVARASGQSMEAS
jgi:hypothetical protein